MTHCCACGNAPLMFPLEKAFSVRWSVVYVCVCVCEDQPLDYWPVVISCCVCVWMFYLCVCVCTWRDSEREKAMGGKSKTREGEWGNVCERGGGKKGWFIPLEQSSPRQPPSHWQRSGATHRPWTHSLVQRAVDEKHTFFSNNRPRFVEEKVQVFGSSSTAKVSDTAARQRRETNTQTHTSKQTNKPIKKNCSVYSSSLFFISFWSTLMFYLPVFSFLLVVFRCTLVLAMLTSVLHVSEASQNWTDCKPDWTTISSQRCWSYLAQSRCVLPPQPNNPGQIFHFNVWGENKEKYFSRVTDPSRFPHIFSPCSNSSWASLVTG